LDNPNTRGRRPTSFDVYQPQCRLAPVSDSGRISGLIGHRANMRADVVWSWNAGETFVENIFADLLGGVQRGFQNVGRRRINQAHVEMSLGHLFGDGLRGDDE